MTILEITRPTILVVDDTPENINVLKGALIADYIIRSVFNGQAAIRAAQVKPYPDLILLDIMMPGMDGYEVCRILKADPATRDIPIIFITAKIEFEDELDGLKLGAVDYITKPFSLPIVQTRVKNHIALQSANRKLDEHNQILLRERKLIENVIIKMRHTDRLDEGYLRYLVSPVEITAGDMLLATFTPDGRQLVLLGDFTGHGLCAAIGGPLVVYIFYELAHCGRSGELILEEINKQLYLGLPTGMFFAATMLEISQNREKATHWGAGLPDTLLIHNHCINNRIQSGMVPLGILKNVSISNAAKNLSLEKGDRLYIFSDGIIEEMDNQHIEFGMERLEAFLEKVSTGENTLKDLLTLLNEHAGSTFHNDDITIVEISI